jgi:flagellar hook-associated protein 2
MPIINFAGLASGIDSNALIDATSEAARKTRVEPNKTKREELEATNTAFDDLKTKLGTLKTALAQFGSLNGGGVSRRATSSQESVMTATASNAAVNGSYSMTVNQLARNHVLTFTNGTGYASPSSAVQSSLTGAEPAADRTVEFTIGTGSNTETVEVELTNGSYSAADFVNAFNAASSKAEASLVNVGTTSSPLYYIVISSNNEGTEKGQIGATYGASLTNLSNVANRNESVAQNAHFDITGIGSIERTSNSINDVLPGVTLSLVSTGTATIRVSEDAATTQARVQEFIDAYNEVVSFLNENNTVSREEDGANVRNVFGPLASTSTDDGSLTALRSQVAAAQAASGTAIRILADIGIETQRDGTLAFKTDRFQTAISSEPNSVSEVLTSLADRVATTGGTIDVYTRFNGLIDVTVNGNKTLISNLNDRIAEAERQIERQADQMRQRFARLESLMGRLQSQQSSLTSALAALGRG